jgi:hypothetical protein
MTQSDFRHEFIKEFITATPPGPGLHLVLVLVVGQGGGQEGEADAGAELLNCSHLIVRLLRSKLGPYSETWRNLRFLNFSVTSCAGLPKYVYIYKNILFRYF